MPTFRHGKGVAVYSNEFDLSTYLNSVSASNGVETPDTTTFGADDRSFIAGHTDGSVSLEGLFEGSADAIDELFDGALGLDTAKVLTLGLESATLGRRALLVSSKKSGYEISSPLTDVVSVTASVVADGGIDYGVYLQKTSATTTSTGTSVDNGASSANGGVAHLHVLSNDRSATVVAKVQHSADNSTWADLVTFATIGIGAETSERVVVASGTTVNRYLRALVTPGAGTGTITFAIAFSRR